MRECISVHIGQEAMHIAGFALVPYQARDDRRSDDSVNEFFHRTGADMIRAVCIMEEETIDEVGDGNFLSIFPRVQVLPGKELSGHYVHREDAAEILLDKIRIMSFACKSLLGFIVVHSFAGGSRLVEVILEKLATDFGNKSMYELTLYSDPKVIGRGFYDAVNEAPTYKTLKSMIGHILSPNDAFYGDALMMKSDMVQGFRKTDVKKTPKEAQPTKPKTVGDKLFEDNTTCLSHYPARERVQTILQQFGEKVSKKPCVTKQKKEPVIHQNNFFHGIVNVTCNNNGTQTECNKILQGLVVQGHNEPKNWGNRKK